MDFPYFGLVWDLWSLCERVLTNSDKGLGISEYNQVLFGEIYKMSKQKDNCYGLIRGFHRC